MKSDREHSGKPPRRTPSAPVPGMPYRVYSDLSDESTADTRRDFDLIESRPISEQGEVPEDASAYNPWREMGWQGDESAFPEQAEPEMPQEEPYFRPMLDLNRELPDAYDDYGEYAREEPYPEPEPELDEPDYPPEPPPPPPPIRSRRFEPWRTAVILSCIAGLLFCGAEVYRIARNVVQSEAELRNYREIYLSKYNEDFTKNAQAVALRPPGETYPPTASPVPVQTPTPTPRIDVKDPLAGALPNGIDPEQSVAPSTPTPARTTLERYPLNPLLIVRPEIEALREENDDIVGQLVIDGILNELVVLRNNTFYLNHNAMGTYAGYGAVFADENVSFRYPPENILLYGRTSNEGKAFASLKNYVSQGITFAQRHAFLSFDNPFEEARYVIFAVIRANSDPGAPDYFNYKRFSFDTDAVMMRYVEEAMERSEYRFNVGVAPTDRLLTLVTLSDGSDTSGIVILCRMLRDGERDGYIQSE